MKMRLAILILLTTAGMLLAQGSSATEIQTGDNQVATTEQTGNGHVSYINQFTDNSGIQNATVTQMGHQHSAEIYQDQVGAGANETNTAVIEQHGNQNSAYQSQYAPAGKGDQNSTASQSGRMNFSQQKVLDGSAVIIQLEQQGNSNAGYQTVEGDNMNGLITTSGRENYAEQTLLGTNNGYWFGPVEIRQEGRENSATQHFTGYGSDHSNNGLISQNGRENEASQRVLGRDNLVESDQAGNENYLEAAQTGEANNMFTAQDGRENEARLAQDGDRNWLETFQDGGSNSADVTITGSENEGYVSSTGDNDVVSVTVNGTGNYFSVSQADGNNNRATVTVGSDDNSATVNQSGSGNSATIIQN